MTTAAPPARFTLRDLPLAAKLVLSVFLVAVGVGYFSALVQLHLQHSSKEGEPLPTPADVVEVFAGLKKADPRNPVGRSVSKLEQLVMAPAEGRPFNGSGSMSPAFFQKDDGEYNKQLKAGRNKAELDAEREGERLFVRAWIHTKTEAQGDAFRDDRLVIPEGMAGRPVTPKYLTDDQGAVKVRSILIERCARCHAKGEAQESYPLQTYDHYLKYMDVPLDRPDPPAGWEWSDRQMSSEKLTQSTHTHLLSFAMLFALTGLVFAFTSFPAFVRTVVAPLALAAEVADVSCWWLARVPGYGPYFALAIIGTGTVGGLSLLVQILGSLWAMYGPKGRAVLALFILLALGAFGGLLAPLLVDELAKEKASAAKAKAGANQPKPAEVAPAAVVKAPAPDKPEAKGNGPKPPQNVPAHPSVPAVSELEALVMGPREGKPWKRRGSMAAAFFEKDGADFKKDVKVRGKALEDEREGEREAVRAWVRLDDAARKAAYEADKLALPADRVGKPITPEFLADDSHVKVKTILGERCARCHVADGDAGDFPLEEYEQLAKYFGPAGKAK